MHASATRPCLALGLAAALVLSPRPASAVVEPASVDARDVEATREFKTATSIHDTDPYGAVRAARRAARIWQDLVETTPENAETAVWRQQRIGQALNALKFAHELSGDCQHVQEAIQAGEAYLGTVPDSTMQHRVTRDHLATVKAAGRECPDPSAAATVPEPEGPAEADAGEQPLVPAQAPTQDEAPARARTYKLLAIGSGVLTGVTAAVALGTGLSRIKEPFRGSAYTAILDASMASFDDNEPANDVAHGPNDDMCVIARGDGNPVNQDVASACDRWDTLGNVAVGMGVTSAIFAVSTIVFAVLAVRAKRSEGASASRAPYGLSLTASPTRRGGVVQGTLRF